MLSHALPSGDDEAYLSAEWPAISGRFGLLAVSDNGVGMTPTVAGSSADAGRRR